MDKKLIAVLVLIIAFFALWKSGWMPSSGAPQAITGGGREQNVPIQEYSISGTVLAIDGSTFTIRALKLMNGPEGNYIGTEEKEARLSNETEVRKLTNKNGDILINDASLAEIALGANLTLYANVDMSAERAFSPSRVDIQVQE